MSREGERARGAEVTEGPAGERDAAESLRADEVWTGPRGRSMVIGIAGGSGSGKTTIAEAIYEEIGPENGVLIQHDSYYRDHGHLPPEERSRVNYDHPDALETELLVRHLGELVEGQPVDVPVYDFKVHARRDETVRVQPRPVILVEGILVLFDAALRELMDLKIFVDTDADLRFMRRLRRDLEERARTLDSVFEQYLATVRPMHLQFVETSKRYADIVIPEGYNVGAVGTVIAMTREFLRRNANA